MQDLVGVAGDVMAALESLRPAFEAPADLEGGLQDGPEHGAECDHDNSDRPWRRSP